MSPNDASLDGASIVKYEKKVRGFLSLSLLGINIRYVRRPFIKPSLRESLNTSASMPTAESLQTPIRRHMFNISSRPYTLSRFLRPGAG